MFRLWSWVTGSMLQSITLVLYGVHGEMGGREELQQELVATDFGHLLHVVKLWHKHAGCDVFIMNMQRAFLATNKRLLSKNEGNVGCSKYQSHLQRECSAAPHIQKPPLPTPTSTYLHTNFLYIGSFSSKANVKWIGRISKNSFWI